MTLITQAQGLLAQAPGPSVTTITRGALAATQKEQKTQKNPACWYKTLTQPVKLYT